MPDAPPRPRAPRAPRAPKASAATDAPDATLPSQAAAQASEDNGGNGGNGGAPRDPGPAAGPAAKARAIRTPVLEAKLQQFFAMPALAFGAAGDLYCAELWAARSDMLASSWYELSKQNTSVKRVLEQLVEGSAWGGVIMSTLAITLPIAKHHGIYRGPDPFALILPGPSAPPATPGQAAGARQERPMTWSRDPQAGPVPASMPTPTRGGDDTGSTPPAPIYLEGAPPGVVTVAASPAQHNGAR